MRALQSVPMAFMDRILSARTIVTDRFPFASFTVTTKPGRFIEVACATDPRLLHTDYLERRSPSCFYTSATQGLVRVESCQATWMMPAEALRRFAGADRLYYALGTYGNHLGDDPRFSIAPYALERVPFIALGTAFSGRSLGWRSPAPSSAPATYGGQAARLRWGGDDVFERQRREQSTAASQPMGPMSHYDDGYGAALWRGESDDDAAELAAYQDDGEEATLEGTGAALTDDEEDGETYGGRVWSRAAEETEAGELEDGFDAARRAPSETSAARGLEEAEAEIEDGFDAARRASETSVASGLEEAEAEIEDGIDAARHGVSGAVQSLGASRSRGLEDDSEAAAYMDDGNWQTGSTGVGYAGRHARYATEDDEQDLPIGPASKALGASSRPLDFSLLDIAEKVRLLRFVGRAESGGEGYSAVGADEDLPDPSRPGLKRMHYGLSFGLLAFTQRTGHLGQVLEKSVAREPALLAAGRLPKEDTVLAVLGADGERVLEMTDPVRTPIEEDRLLPVGGAPLWQAPWLARFASLGRLGHVRAAQNEVGIAVFVDPMLTIARDLGLDTPRSLALLIDRAVHMGPAGARSWVLGVVGPIRTEADRDRALRALGHDAGDLRAFQAVRGLEPDGRWGPLTHAAMVRALRSLGRESPVAVPTAHEIVKALVDAAADQGFQDRVRRIVDERTELDDSGAYQPG